MKDKSRKAADDYANEYIKIQNNLTALENRVSERLFFLCKKYPDVPVVMLYFNSKTFYKAKSLGNKYYIETLPVKTRIDYIRIIENHLADLIGKQTEINFK
jgi:hypothetical protein